MIILSANGLSSQKLLDETKKYMTASMKTAVIVTTASVGYKDKDWHIPRLTTELESLGLVVEYFDFDCQSAEALLNYNVILINGGNPFYLLKRMKESNCKSIFESFSNETIIIGVSAGSIVLQDSIELVAQYSPEMNHEINLTDLSGLGLVNLEILPHYNKFLSRFERFEERASEYEKANNCNAIRINDGQAVFVCDDREYVV